MQSIMMPPLPEGVTGDEMVESGRAEPGDCIRACVASITELELAQVPHFVSYRQCATTDKHLWWWALIGWFHAHGIDMDLAPSTQPPDGWSIAEGTGPRGYEHVVVAYDGQYVHDPHPDGGNLVVLTGFYRLTPRIEWAESVLGRVPSSVVA